MRLALLLLPCLLLLVGCGTESKATTPPPGTTVKLHTLPDLHPPILRIDDPANGTAPGYVMFAEKGGKTRPSGVVIADNQGRIVWYHEVPAGLEATDFRAQTYLGKPVLTWWQGVINKAGTGRGTYEIYDSSYKELATVKAGHGYDGDLHEFELTPRGTAYITIYHEVEVDLRSVGGPKNGYAEDSIVQEIDIKTGNVVFEWHSLDHVPLTESIQANREPARHATKKRPLDYFHINSIADGPGGTILISGRNTSALYLLRRDGSIVWRLGGKKQRLRAGRRGQVPLPAQRSFPRPDGDLAVRQRLDPEGGAVHAPARPEDRLGEQDGEGGRDVRASAGAQLAVRGQPRAVARRRSICRLGRRPEADGVLAGRLGALRADAAVRRHVSRLPIAVDRQARRRAARRRRRRPRLRELERASEASRGGRCSPGRTPTIWP